MSIEAEDFALIAACKLSDSSGEFMRKEQKVFEGDVLAEWHEVNLVVAANARAICVNDERRVVIPPGLIRRGNIHSDGTNNDRCLRGACHGSNSLLKSRILFGKGRRGFGPRYEIRMSRIRRAHNFASRCAGLRNSCDIGLALLFRETSELTQVEIPFTAGPRILGTDIEIGLDQNRRGCSGNSGRGEQDASPTAEQQKYPNCAENKPLLSKAENERSSDERVHDDKNEADAIGTGQGRKLIYERVVHLGIAKLVPGHTGDASRGKLEGGPQNWRSGQRKTRAACGAAHQYHAQPEKAKI
jgi:hypothetical protein